MDITKGWKTYGIAICGVVGALGQLLDGNINVTQFLAALFAGLALMGVRSALATEAEKIIMAFAQMSLLHKTPPTPPAPPTSGRTLWTVPLVLLFPILIVGCWQVHQRDERTIANFQRAIEYTEADWALTQQLFATTPTARDLRGLEAREKAKEDFLDSCKRYEEAKTVTAQ